MRLSDPVKRRKLVKLLAEHKSSSSSVASAPVSTGGTSVDSGGAGVGSRQRVRRRRKRRRRRRRPEKRARSRIRRGQGEGPDECACTRPYIDKWVRASRREVVDALAIPKPARLRPWPDPQLEIALPVPVARSSLHGRVPRRVLKLAEPKRREPYAPPVPEPASSVPDAADRVPSMSRILWLSKPRPAKRRVHRRCDRQDSATVERKREAGGNPKTWWAERDQWLSRNARPKRVFRRPLVARRRLRMTLDQAVAMVSRLARVPEHRRYMVVPPRRTTEPRPRGPLVPLSAAWVGRLSAPRKVASETKLNMEFDPGVISRSALKAVATKRTVELATPKFMVKTAVDADTKDNPFSVSSKALKYKATKRIKALAAPRIR